MHTSLFSCAGLGTRAGCRALGLGRRANHVAVRKELFNMGFCKAPLLQWSAPPRSAIHGHLVRATARPAPWIAASLRRCAHRSSVAARAAGPSLAPVNTSCHSATACACVASSMSARHAGSGPVKEPSKSAVASYSRVAGMRRIFIVPCRRHGGHPLQRLGTADVRVRQVQQLVRRGAPVVGCPRRLAQRPRFRDHLRTIRADQADGKEKVGIRGEHP